MNTKSFYLIVFLLTTTFAFGSVKPIPITSATIEWKAYKIAYERWGNIQLKSGELLFEDDALTGGNFVVDMTSIQVTSLEGKKKASLEKHLRSDDFFGIEEFPTAEMVIARFATFPISFNAAIDPTSLPAYQAVADYLIKKP